MSFIFNDPSDFVTEMLEGFLAAHAGQVMRVAGGVVRAHETPSGEVAVVTGGGSGHYPAFCGLVGPGLAHGAAMGEVFASPSASRVLSVVRAVHAGAGVFFTYGNYAGDGLNFDAAQDQLRGEGVSCHTVRVTDDVSSAPREERHNRRGVAGDLTVLKVAGAAAAAGYSLDRLVAVAERANERTFTFGVAFSGCTLPGAPEPLFVVPAGRMGVGMGIHGEPGVGEGPILGARELAAMLVNRLLEEKPVGVPEQGARVVALVNGLGSVKLEELFLLYGQIQRELGQAGITVWQPEVGELVTSFETAGVSLTLFWLDDELENLWSAPATAPAYHKGQVTGGARSPRLLEVSSYELGTNEASAESVRLGTAISEMLDIARRTIDKAAGELGRLDAVAGDGDHGLGMQRGTRAASEAAQKVAGTVGAQSVLRVAGDAWAERAGGTSGALWGALLRDLGGILGDDAPAEPERIVLALHEAARGLTSRGGAVPGDKTMVDAVLPFVAAFAEAIQGGRDVTAALGLSAEAAMVAAAATADLVPKRGRARTHGEKSLGTPDPGAQSFALIVHDLAQNYGGGSS